MFGKLFIVRALDLCFCCQTIDCSFCCFKKKSVRQSLYVVALILPCVLCVRPRQGVLCAYFQKYRNPDPPPLPHQNIRFSALKEWISCRRIGSGVTQLELQRWIRSLDKKWAAASLTALATHLQTPDGGRHFLYLSYLSLSFSRTLSFSALIVWQDKPDTARPFIEDVGGSLFVLTYCPAQTKVRLRG